MPWNSSGAQKCCCSLMAVFPMSCICESKPKKFPDSYLKSPGIKQRGSGRGVPPGPLPSMESTLFRGSTRISEDREPHSPRILNTPPTPSTPLTPPHSSLTAISDNSIFAPVLIPQSGNLSPGPSTSVSSVHPPPIPPRRNTSPQVKQAPDAPLLPPRDSSPPPLPPRTGNTLPRVMSSTGSSVLREGPGTLPRRNSALDMATMPPPPVVAPRRGSHSSVNGPPTGPTPQLPPRTHRQNTQPNHTSPAPR